MSLCIGFNLLTREEDGTESCLELDFSTLSKFCNLIPRRLSQSQSSDRTCFLTHVVQAAPSHVTLHKAWTAGQF